jgi:hypothetical protein
MYVSYSIGWLGTQVYNQTKHDYEITLERQSQVLVVDEDAESAAIPRIRFSVKPLPDVCSVVVSLA